MPELGPAPDFEWPPSHWPATAAAALSDQPASDPLATPPGYDDAVAGISDWRSLPPPDLGAAAQAGIDVLPAALRGDAPAAAPTLGHQLGAGVLQPGESVLDAMGRVATNPAPQSVADFIRSPGITALGASAGDVARVRAAELAPFAARGWGPHPPAWVGGPPDAPVLPDPTTEVEPGMAATETFMPDQDPDPAGRAAERTAAAAQAEQDAIDAQAAAYDRLDPIAFADVQAKRQLKLEQERATRELELAERDRQELEANIKRRELATAAAQRDLADVTARTKAMADSSPFESWWADRSVPQKFAGVLATVFAGLGNRGGRNQALDTFIGMANADAGAKWKKLEARRGLAQDAMANAGADFREREAIRLASFTQMQRGIEQQLAQLDPRGTAAQRLSELHRGVGAQIAEGMKALEAEQYKRHQDAIKVAQDDARIAIDALKAADAHAAAVRKAGGGGAGGGLKGKYTPAELKAILPEGSWIPPEGTPPMTIAEYTKLAGAGRAGRTVTEPTEREKRDHELAVSYPDGKPLLQSDGTPFLARDTDVRKETEGKVAAASEIADIIDEVLAIRDAVGGESSVFNSDESQRLKVLQNRLVMIQKAGTQGMSSDEDMKKIAAALGASDVSSFRARAAGLKEGRQRTISELNTWLGSHGYDGPPLKFSNQRKRPRARPDPDVATLVSREEPASPVVYKGTGSADAPPPMPTGPMGPMGPSGPAGPGGPAVPGGRLEYDAAGTQAAVDAMPPEQRDALARGLTTEQQKSLDNLVSKARAGDAVAAGKLAQVAGDGRTNRRASSAAMIALTAIAADATNPAAQKIALKALHRQIDPESADEDAAEGGEE